MEKLYLSFVRLSGRGKGAEWDVVIGSRPPLLPFYLAPLGWAGCALRRSGAKTQK